MLLPVLLLFLHPSWTKKTGAVAHMWLQPLAARDDPLPKSTEVTDTAHSTLTRLYSAHPLTCPKSYGQPNIAQLPSFPHRKVLCQAWNDKLYVSPGDSGSCREL